MSQNPRGNLPTVYRQVVTERTDNPSTAPPPPQQQVPQQASYPSSNRLPFDSSYAHRERWSATDPERSHQEVPPQRGYAPGYDVRGTSHSILSGPSGGVQASMMYGASSYPPSGTRFEHQASQRHMTHHVQSHQPGWVPQRHHVGMEQQSTPYRMPTSFEGRGADIDASDPSGGFAHASSATSTYLASHGHQRLPREYASSAPSVPHRQSSPPPSRVNPPAYHGGIAEAPFSTTHSAVTYSAPQHVVQTGGGGGRITAESRSASSAQPPPPHHHRHTHQYFHQHHPSPPPMSPSMYNSGFPFGAQSEQQAALPTYGYGMMNAQGGGDPLVASGMPRPVFPGSSAFVPSSSSGPHVAVASPVGRSCFVGNIPNQITAEQLEDLFAQAAPAPTRPAVRIHKDGRYAFVTFHCEQTATMAASLLHGYNLWGKIIRVEVTQNVPRYVLQQEMTHQHIQQHTRQHHSAGVDRAMAAPQVPHVDGGNTTSAPSGAELPPRNGPSATDDGHATHDGA